jgi:hypothetical protein
MLLADEAPGHEDGRAGVLVDPDGLDPLPGRPAVERAAQAGYDHAVQVDVLDDLVFAE